MTIADFLTDEEITGASKLYKRCREGGIMHLFAGLCKDEFITPNMPRIERALGQQMDAMFLAYAVEHVMNEASK